jgi:hypothetical protein
VLTFPTFERFRVPTFNLQPRRSGATFNPLHLILEKKKIQITMEEQMLKPPFLCFSPIPGGPSIVNRLFSTFKRSDVQTFKRFHLQPSAIDPQKRNSKKQTQIKSSPPAYTPSPSSYPHLYGSRP